MTILCGARRSARACRCQRRRSTTSRSSASTSTSASLLHDYLVWGAQERTGVSLPTAPQYDIQIKRIHEYNRQSTT